MFVNFPHPTSASSVIIIFTFITKTLPEVTYSLMGLCFRWPINSDVTRRYMTT